MSLNLEDKKAVVAEIAKQVGGAQAIVMAENRGLPVAQFTKLRKQARESGVYLKVLKNTLVRRAVADTPFSGLADKMSGPLTYGMGPDPVAVAKVLNDFAKGNDKFVITGRRNAQLRHVAPRTSLRWPRCPRAMNCWRS